MSTSKNNRRRRVRMDRFKAQLAEAVIGEDSLLEVEVGEDEAVVMRLPVLLPEGDDYQERVANAAGDSGRAAALLILGYHPTRSAEEQLDVWESAGYTTDDLAAVFGAETNAARERLGNFRFNG